MIEVAEIDPWDLRIFNFLIIGFFDKLLLTSELRDWELEDFGRSEIFFKFSEVLHIFSLRLPAFYSFVDTDEARRPSPFDRNLSKVFLWLVVYELNRY